MSRAAPGSAVTPLSRQTILEHSLAIADERGFDALTMRSVAETLGVAPMALYRHVRHKEDLVNAVVDLAMGRLVVPPLGPTWHESLRRLNHAIRRDLLAQPGLIGPLVSRPALGGNALAVRERSVAILLRAGMTPELAERGTGLLLVYTIGFVALETPRRAAGYRADGTTAAERTAAYESLVADRFPHLAEIATTPAEIVSDAQYAFGLDRILDGIAVAAGSIDAPGTIRS